jgi:hypothetical protein
MSAKVIGIIVLLILLLIFAIQNTQPVVLNFLLANFYLFRPIHSGEFRNWLADRMLTDDDWKDEEKESTVLIILFPTCCHSLLPDFSQES